MELYENILILNARMACAGARLGHEHARRRRMRCNVTHANDFSANACAFQAINDRVDGQVHGHHAACSFMSAWTRVRHSRGRGRIYARAGTKYLRFLRDLWSIGQFLKQSFLRRPSRCGRYPAPDRVQLVPRALLLRFQRLWARLAPQTTRASDHCLLLAVLHYRAL